jgi:hypothetical protein
MIGSVPRGGPPGSGARPVGTADRPAIGAMLARAFHDDPVMVYMFPEPAERRRKLPRLFELLFAGNLPLGGCDVTEGGETASLWRPPGKVQIPLWTRLVNTPAILAIYGFAGTSRAMRLLGVMERHHPREPHWYLMLIGTEPQKQGRGFAGIVLRHRLAQIDAARLPAYLEASKPENVPIYASVGFEQCGELSIPGGPVIYPMWRPAR